MSNGPLYAMGGAHPNAVNAERSAPNAMRGLATGAREGKPLKREQTIYTPQEIIDVCVGLWGQIALDPCSGPNSIVPAVEAWCGTQVDTGRKGKNGPIMEWRGSGLLTGWTDYTYVNPPFEVLEGWLAKSMFECESGATEQVLLFPVRPNRVWWSTYMSSVPSRVAWLKPLAFHGQEQALPVPLVLVYTGARANQFHRLVEPLSTFVGGRLA